MPEPPSHPINPPLNPGPVRPGRWLVTVAVDPALDSDLTYLVPPELTGLVRPGVRVVVPLGRTNKPVGATVLRTDPCGNLASPLELESDFPRDSAQTGHSPPPAVPPSVITPDPRLATGQLIQEFHPATLWPEAKTPPRRSAPARTLKMLQSVLTDIDPIPEELLTLARWISQYYCCPLGVVLSTIAPAAVKRNRRIPSEIFISLGEPSGSTPNSDEPEVLAASPGEPQGLSPRSATVEVSTPPVPSAASPDVKLSARAKKVFSQIQPLLAAQAVPQGELIEKCGVTRPMLKRLLRAGLLKSDQRVPLPQTADLALERTVAETVSGTVSTKTSCSPSAAQGVANRDSAKTLQLTADQQAALDEIVPLLDPPRFAVRLIHGVTGSGKTELYIRCIERVLAAGRTAIVLVPEIALTAQAVARYTARFQRVTVLHSGLTESQRRQHWSATARGWAQVVVGARSAVFAPVCHLGLIVVDEEHEWSYKQDNAPRYHARDVAIRRAQLAGVPVLLGSATPALESWHNARHNPHYKLLSLTSRPGHAVLPRVITVDMKAERRQRRGLHALSTVLEFHLRQTLATHGQAILLLNRRGWAHYVACARCDWVLGCEHCDATMVVHHSLLNPLRRNPRPSEAAVTVQCHYCLTSRVLPGRCPQCQARLVELGQGTQRAEDELRRKFPGLRLARMDSDAMRNAADYRDVLNRFASGELDLLIGTQMIAKGLDFPNVRLVGVLNADLAMTVPDFRAAERTFQLVCQVAGRGGRPSGKSLPSQREVPGSATCDSLSKYSLVVVQTMQPQEPAIVFAARHDYAGFAKDELAQRQTFGYPPFGRLVRLVVSHRSERTATAFAENLKAMIQKEMAALATPPTTASASLRLWGPQPAPRSRLMDLHRYEIFLRAASAAPLQRWLAALRHRGLLRQGAASVTVDVDPLQMQ